MAVGFFGQCVRMKSTNAYDPMGVAVVAKDFLFAGTEYKAGAEFPWEKLGIRDLQLRGLWAAGCVKFERQKVVYVDQNATSEEQRASKGKRQPGSFRGH